MSLNFHVEHTQVSELPRYHLKPETQQKKAVLTMECHRWPTATRGWRDTLANLLSLLVFIVVVCFFNLMQARVIWGEEPQWKKMPPSDYLYTVQWGH